MPSAILAQSKQIERLEAEVERLRKEKATLIVALTNIGFFHIHLDLMKQSARYSAAVAAYARDILKRLEEGA